MRKKRAAALGLLCAGFLCSGISCSLYVYCRLGSDAFNVMTQGLSDTLGIQAGNAFYIIQGAMFLRCWPWDGGTSASVRCWAPS